MTKKTINNSNPFVFEQNNETGDGSNRLELTPQLISLSNARATDLMRTVGQQPELHELANTALDRSETQDVINLINAVYDEEHQIKDAEFLMGADEEQLSRLLESRRSDRSKAKAKGPRTNVSICQTFISAMYAELLVRRALNKPYQAATVDTVDYDDLAADQEALNKKIRSLQSKKSRLSKTAEFVPEDQAELEATIEEIDRLISLRTTGRVAAKTVIKSAPVEEIRAALSMIDASKLEASEQAKLEELMAKLG